MQSSDKILFSIDCVSCTILSTEDKAVNKIVMVPIHTELLIWG